MSHWGNSFPILNWEWAVCKHSVIKIWYLLLTTHINISYQLSTKTIILHLLHACNSSNTSLYVLHNTSGSYTYINSLMQKLLKILWVVANSVTNKITMLLNFSTSQPIDMDKYTKNLSSTTFSPFWNHFANIFLSQLTVAVIKWDCKAIMKWFCFPICFTVLKLAYSTELWQAI